MFGFLYLIGDGCVVCSFCLVWMRCVAVVDCYGYLGDCELVRYGFVVCLWMRCGCFGD